MPKQCFELSSVRALKSTSTNSGKPKGWRLPWYGTPNHPWRDVKADAQRAVEQTMEQARWAVDNYFNFVQKIISSFPSGGTELGEKLKSCAEKNITVAHEFVRKLSQAKNLQ